ncbi:hypothetical protein CcaverHIS002_0303770 [Cutaneotrichosporon cavernicola]|uniref:BTB domain-containing protein n=1 Tax=Cutaneotrichosporon cavernicola TaxID=279322 RepID=A0AA48L1W0_9TREE|nr:uncharacterized protein CcaverHIS019_0303750 [Cutaneotrichosporon cavernicola]BEI82509.1 hypothetical protein CcaverHIS002_0303770 [Cutaneotrichosporon cavernicola]BEI90305.1 hypothetical protein CcaverHIS019_0303750 [Cutaneotrichosporon cavernicola]BEI98081.1 hypothetical protein CcaverHIS631_0303800 [Cutaneotrichosporon cavernicola]BEJ05858.1 hypothetical protein CcaverHIS641_0303800 [Cutaneotrichosporon cavernicola]
MGLLNISDHLNRTDITPSTGRSSLNTLITDDHQWTDGEIELISSDSVRFRIPFYVLAHSIALRDIRHIDPNEDCSFTLLDPEFELAMVLRLFFKFVTQGELCNTDLDEYNISLTHFARFLVKWDCAVTRSHFLTFIRDEVRMPVKDRRIGPLTCFKVGAILGCPRTCASALDAPIGSAKSPLDPFPTIDYNVLDPSRWDIGHLVDIPVEYHWALQRAFYRYRFQFVSAQNPVVPKTLGEWFIKYQLTAPAAIAMSPNKRL